MKFCGECGARLQAVCPACRHANPPGQKFCGECGAALAAPAPAAQPVPAPPPERFASPAAYTPRHLAEKILTSRGALEGERKSVTVMFSDVSGFTAMSERLDPEDVHTIMDRAFEVILGAVHRYEGTINQFLGDGVMALFGAPIAHEDHAQRALCAALDIQKGLAPLADDVRHTQGIEFRMRMGINTGLVVVGAIGKDLRMDYTAVGDTTNLAARLLSIAGPGQIVVSERTHQLRDRFFTFDDLGEHELKGKSRPVRAYAVTGEIHGQTRLEVSKERGLTPLVGREPELGRLARAYDRATAGQGAVVLVAGEPGLGKSRLLYEFLAGLGPAPLLELETTCVSYGRTIPYRPVLELLRRYLGLTDTMTAEEIRDRVGRRVDLLGLESEESLALFAHFMGATAPAEFLNRLSGAELKERTFAVLRDVLLRASEAAPLVVIVENVHWADASSLEFFAHLAGSLPGHRILLAVSTRPGFTAPWLVAPLAETITLDALATADMEQMIRSLLGASSVAEALFTLLVEKGEGNPLYVEEILLQLRETGGLVVEDGEARLRSADVKVPATIQDIIAARVDRLVETLKLSLQGAAVIGRRFGISLLSHVIELPPDEAGQELRELHGLDFVFPSSQDPELMYSFKHALTQDVVYAGLLDRRRRQYHRAAGIGLEQLYAEHIEDVVELLAYHFGRSGDDEQAVDYDIAAAEKAQRRWANAEALAFFEDALRRLGAMPDNEANRRRRVDAVVKQAELMFALGRHAEHVRAMEAIRPLIDATPDAQRRAAWYYWVGFLHSLTGSRPEISIGYCEQAREIAEAEGLEELRASADCCLCHVFGYAGRLREALAAGERALPVFEARGNIWWACRTLWGLSLTAIQLGDWARSLAYCRRGLEYGESVKDRRLRVVGSWRQGWTQIQQGQIEGGLRSCEHGLALSPSPFDAAMTRAVRAYGLIKLGQGEAGTTELAEQVAWFEQSRLSLTRTWYALWLADGYLLQAQAERARPLAEEVLKASRDAGYRYFEGVAQRIIGTSLIDADRAAAEMHLAAALDILEEIGAQNELAKTLVARAQLSRAAGDSAAARPLLERARDIFEALGTIDEIARIRALLDGRS
jgi:class 3 adenylate cyclase/tetratricopeptide (TPR) repeat protein